MLLPKVCEMCELLLVQCGKVQPCLTSFRSNHGKMISFHMSWPVSNGYITTWHAVIGKQSVMI